MDVVVDTNVFVSALLGREGSASRAVIRACLEGRLQPIMGAALFHEYEDLLSRHELLDRSVLAPEEREALLNAFLSVCRWTRVYFLWRPNLPDEADNQVLEVAVAGGAEVVVTYNTRDFERAELHFPQLQILRPEQLLQELKDGDTDDSAP